MRNLVCLGRTRTEIEPGKQGDTDPLPVTAIAPLPSFENVFFAAKGPAAQNREMAVFRVEALPLFGTHVLICAGRRGANAHFVAAECACGRRDRRDDRRLSLFE